MTRYLGYLARRPYLWWVDTESRSIDPAAELRKIPQGIDDIVPLADAVAVRCGPHWFGLRSDLGGEPFRLTAEAAATAARRSTQVEVSAEWIGPARLTRLEKTIGTVEHPEVAYWYEIATISPDERTVAIAGSTEPRPSPEAILAAPLMAEGKYRKQSCSVLALFDVATGSTQICSGRFDNFCYPPAWAAAGTTLVIGMPFEPKRLGVLDVKERLLTPLRFGRWSPPMPLLDEALLQSR